LCIYGNVDTIFINETPLKHSVIIKEKAELISTHTVKIFRIREFGELSYH